MARAPLLQLSNVTHGIGQTALFKGLDLVIQPGDRLALVGRNGSGKSTLMRVMAGQIAPDDGTRSLAPGTSVEYLEQEPDFTGFDTLGAHVRAGLSPDKAWQADPIAQSLDLDLSADPRTASGGERRRAALVRLMAAEPELLLLDEPTNHLDIQAISWLENRLRNSRAAFVLISHDRAFLTALSRGVLWIDRGEVRRLDRGFDRFEEWRDTAWAEEDLARHKLDRKIKAEARWAVEGISARRKRNMGRVRALAQLRADRAAIVRRQGTAGLNFEAGSASGKKVIEAVGITKSYSGRPILKPFDLRVLRGDRVAIVGPNGAGKTTLVRLLIGAEDPDSGSVTLGTHVRIAEFDQARAALDPDQSLWESLTGDPAIGKSGRSDQVMVRGTPRHVVGYLKEFLFDESQARAPVHSLSGGERARLLLARLMARPSNLLVLDEPTNDLDIETLDLLQDVLAEYPGTVLLVSHDRDFIDRVATATVLLEGEGRAVLYAGGWSDMVAQRGAAPGDMVTPKTRQAKKTATAKPAPAGGNGAVQAEKDGPPKPGGPRALSFTESHRLDALPGEIDRLTAEIGKLEGLLADPDLHANSPAKFRKALDALAERQEKLTAAEEEWLALAERAEATQSQRP